MAGDQSSPAPENRGSGLASDGATPDGQETPTPTPPVSLRSLLQALDALLEEQKSAQDRNAVGRADDAAGVDADRH